MPAPIELGSLLFTAVEPHRGHEVAYNRWYQSDHFYAGCMVGAHQFAGARFVATKRLKALRSPASSLMCEDPAGGSFLSIYWVLKGFHDEWVDWAVTTVNELHAEGRMFDERDHTHTGVYEHHSSVQRTPTGTSIELALDRHFAGVIVTAGELIDGSTLDEVATWTSDVWEPQASASEWGPEVIGTSRLMPLPSNAPGVPEVVENNARFLQLHFVDHDPAHQWEAGYGRWADALADSGLATHIWTAPYLATVHGTDTYTDELW